MHVEAEILIASSPAEVYEFLGRAERLPQYVAEFTAVQALVAGEPQVGSEYRYTLMQGQVQGSFRWIELSAHSRLAWSGPIVSTDAGSVEPAGSWQLAPQGGGTRVKLVLAPALDGLLAVMAPLLAATIEEHSGRALARLKLLVEQRSGPAPGQAGTVGTL